MFSCRKVFEARFDLAVIMLVNARFDQSEGRGRFPDVGPLVPLLREHLRRRRQNSLLRVFCHACLRFCRAVFRLPIVVNERSLVNSFTASGVVIHGKMEMEQDVTRCFGTQIRAF